MSYDLMVFDPDKAPRTKKVFFEWYSIQTEKGGDDYRVASVPLQNWFMEMKEKYPPMNGPLTLTDEQLAADERLDTLQSDYGIGEEMIYVAFAWSICDEVYEDVLRLARKHKVGLYEVSHCHPQIILPDGTLITDEEPKRSVWGKVKRLLNK